VRDKGFQWKEIEPNMLSSERLQNFVLLSVVTLRCFVVLKNINDKDSLKCREYIKRKCQLASLDHTSRFETRFRPIEMKYRWDQRVIYMWKFFRLPKLDIKQLIYLECVIFLWMRC